MNKYRAGGRCGGTTSTYSESSTNSAEFSAFLRKREEQDRLFAPSASSASSSPAQQAAQTPLPMNPKQETTLVISQKPKQDKKNIIDTILNGDMEF
jgi:hypothetical protein